MQDIAPHMLPLLMLYAEIHFRFFPLFPSLLYKRLPEILFDLPRRVDPGNDLPVILILNDIHKFPIKIDKVSITVSSKETSTQVFDFNEFINFEINHSLNHQLRVLLFQIPREDLPDGEILVNGLVSITKGNKNYQIINDNLFTSSKLPFRCFLGKERLPGNQYAIYGDLHNHSIYSQSHVEFGPPLKIYDLLAKSSGLQFLGITDHSYDLACDIDNYLIQDQSLTKWKMLCDDFKTQFNTIMLQGEEISCLNREGKVVHLCGLGLKKYISGTLDGARKNIANLKQLTISQAGKEIHSQGGIAFAAHPGSKAGFLQQQLLHRGQWSESEDFSCIDGFQALNSGFLKSWSRAKSLWINLLQKGVRIPLLGGNDAHGDFNRYRAISAPFIKLYECFERFMGYGKTGIYGKHSSPEEIINAIRNGATFVTSGPFVSITRESDHNESVISNVAIKPTDLLVHAISTREFGRIQKVSIFASENNNAENRLLLKYYKEPIFDVKELLPSSDLPQNGYIRAEITSMLADGTTFEAYTSPCYFCN